MTAIEVARKTLAEGVSLFRFRKGQELNATDPPQYDWKPYFSGNKRKPWVILDTFSAGHIVAVYDNLSAENQAKYNRLPIWKMAEIGFKLVKPKGSSHV